MVEPRTDISIGLPADDAELQRFGSIAAYAFGASSDAPRVVRWEPERYRLMHVAGNLAGGLNLHDIGQWFGGRRVPMMGVAGVAIAPEYRALGLSTTLMRNMLEESHARGIALSTLFPATQEVYRRVGYEQAGTFMRYQQPLHGLPHNDRSLLVRQATATDHEAIRAIYTERARRTAGNLDRSTDMWNATLGTHTAGVHTFVVTRGDEPEGYISLRQQYDRDEQGKTIVVKDMVALTADAERRLLSFLASHRTTASSMVWAGPPASTLICHLPNPTCTVVAYNQWMLRIVDIPSALEARGYPSAIEGELHLDIQDTTCSWNAGRWILTVSAGRGDVRKGGHGAVRLDIRGLAPLYSGYLSAEELLSAGYIEGKKEDLALSSLIFSGPSPWTAEEF